MKVAEVQVPLCGVFSFPLPHPAGHAPEVVNVGSHKTRVTRMTARVVLVEGLSTPGTKNVSVFAGGSHANPPSLRHAHHLRTENESFPLMPGAPETSMITPGGVRFTVFRNFIGDNVFFSVEIANAEWKHLHSGAVWGPRKIPAFEILHGTTQIYHAPLSLAGKTLNPREHTSINFATGPKADAMNRFEHMVQTTGEYSYQQQDAWGPQESKIPNPPTTIPQTPFRAAPIQNSPLTPMGMPDGNETGGALIEVAVLPAVNDPQATAWLFDVMKCIMDREPIWAFRNDEPCDDKSMAEAYDGEIPYRAADTNRWDKMMPEFFLDKWKTDHVPKTDHNYKAHDGQHFVRATCTPKSLFWNTGSLLAKHNLEQLSAHIRLCRTAYPVKNPGWGYNESVYDALNREPDREVRDGRGIGRREDAWGMEAQVMDYMINYRQGTMNWLTNNAVIISKKLLPTGVGNLQGNTTVLSYLSLYHAKPPLSDIQDGAGYQQLIEVSFYTHALFCLSRLPQFRTLAEPLVVKASDLIASSHFKWEPSSTRMAPPWYIQVRNPDGSIPTEVTHGQGKYQENWHGMTMHGYALRINPLGRHLEYLEQLYGTDLDHIPDNGGYELGRAQMMMGALEQTVVIDPPIVEPPISDTNPRIAELEESIVTLITAHNVELANITPRYEALVDQQKQLAKQAADEAVRWQKEYENLETRIKSILANLFETN